MTRRAAKKASRRYSKSLALLMSAMLLVAVLAVAAPAAFAYGTYSHGGIDPNTGCTQCHSVSTAVPPTTADCTKCHTGYALYSGDKQTCSSCHHPGQAIDVSDPTACTAGCHLANGTTATHVAHFGSTTAACTTCHNVPLSATNPNGSHHHDAVNSVTKTTVTLQLTGLTSGAMRLGKTVTAKGTVKPVRTGTVLVTIQRKVGTSWVKAIAKARTMTAAGAYSYAYKPGKRGTYRVQSKTTAKVPYSSVKTAWKTFKVK
jgi:hypothetical protein